MSNTAQSSPRLARLHRLAIGVLLLTSLYLAWQPNASSLLQHLTGLSYDLLITPSAPADDSRITIVDIDDQSLQSIGRWPWSRPTLAQLLSQIQQHQPAVIGLDFLLPEAGPGDLLLKQQLAASNVITPITYGLSPGPGPLVQNRIGLSPSLNTPDKTQLAHITPSYDSDGSIRKLYPIICQNSCSHTLALAMLETLIQQPAQRIDQGQRLPDSQLCAGPYCLKLDKNDALWIPYQNWKNVRHISAASLLRGERHPGLQGSMVLLGTSAVGLGDNVTTPLSPDTPGVRIHANLLASWFDSIAWQPLPHSALVSSLLLIGWALLAWRWPTLQRTGQAITLLTATAIILLPLLLARYGYWFNPLATGLLISTGLLSVASYQALHSHQQRRWLHQMFGHYVPPEVVDQLVRSKQENRALSPHRARVTVLFADIQGFTSLSEKLSPEQLADMTNRLFTELTDEIHQHQGTLDKYMGDAVMAFWGAPLHQPDHAQRAFNCALRLEQRLHSLTPWLRAHNLPPLKLSIALETGDATVGNLGSRQRRAYTVLGRCINLAAHLQSMHKEIGHNLLFGPELCRTLPGQIQLLPAAHIRGISGPQQIGTAMQQPPADTKKPHPVHTDAAHETTQS